MSSNYSFIILPKIQNKLGNSLLFADEAHSVENNINELLVEHRKTLFSTSQDVLFCVFVAYTAKIMNSFIWFIHHGFRRAAPPHPLLLLLMSDMQ